MNSIVNIRFQKSSDDEIHKYVFKTNEVRGSFETSSFFIFSLNRHDLCISCMAGCPMGCTPCATTYSESTFERMLNSEEMCAQIKISVKNREEISNPNTELRIGFMGNGEPFANFRNVAEAIMSINKRTSIRVSSYIISTIGYEPQNIQELYRLSEITSTPIKLQFSLFSMDDAERKILVPAGLPLTDMLTYLDEYAISSKIPVRYNLPLISNVNNSLSHLEKIVQFFAEKPLLRRLKLSVYNSFPGSPYLPCTDEEILETAALLEKWGILVDLFWGNRNDLIFASCGQMRASI